MAQQKPRLLFKADIRRRPYFRRFVWSLLAIVAAFGAFVALDYVNGLNVVDPVTLYIGKLVALLVVALFVLRGLSNLFRAIVYRDESLRFYDRGFVWTRKGVEHKYGWNKVATFREGVRDLHLFGRPVIQLGAHTLTMQDGTVFRVTGRYGDTRAFANVVRRYIAAVTGTRMAQALRQEQSITIHPQLVIHPGGIEAGKHEILWSELNVQRKPQQLLIRQAGEGGYKTMKRFSVQSVDNLGGFMELAAATIRNHQRGA